MEWAVGRAVGWVAAEVVLGLGTVEAAAIVGVDPVEQHAAELARGAEVEVEALLQHAVECGLVHGVERELAAFVLELDLHLPTIRHLDAGVAERIRPALLGRVELPFVDQGHFVDSGQCHFEHTVSEGADVGRLVKNRAVLEVFDCLLHEASDDEGQQEDDRKDGDEDGAALARGARSEAWGVERGAH